MKVKIKGLVFVGFAAAILSANAMAAADDNIVTSKSYVDAKIVDNVTGDNENKAPSQLAVKTALGTKQDKDNTLVYKVGQQGAWQPAYNAVAVDTTYLTKTDSDSTGVATVAIDTTKMTTTGVDSQTGQMNLSTSSSKLVSEKAVAEAVNAVSSGAAGAYQPKTVAKIQVATLDSQNKPTWAGMGDAVNTGTYTTKSVDAQTGVITIEANGTTDTSLASDTGKLPTAATVKTYVDGAIDALGSGIAGSDYVTASYNASTDSTTIALVDSRITSSSALQSNSTKLTREQDVYGAIQAATGGTTIPAQNPSVCTASTPCALVAEYNSTNTAMELHWRTMATATDSGGVLGDAQ